VRKRDGLVVCTSFAVGREHDFKLFKESRVALLSTTKALVDTGYLGIGHVHANHAIPVKRSKYRPRTKADRRHNRQVARERVAVENVICSLKRFRIVSDKYRNRRKRFGLRFNLIAGIHNYELA
jgi:DDE superfamily endonuclease